MKKELLEKASYLHKAELEQLHKAILVSEKAQIEICKELQR